MITLLLAIEKTLDICAFMTAGFVVHDPALSACIKKSTVNDMVEILPVANRGHAQLAAGVGLFLKF